MDWRARFGDKLSTPEDAVKLVTSGSRVYVGMFSSTPAALCSALFARNHELRGVTVLHYIAPFVWATPDTQEAFRLVTLFSSAADRLQVREGLADYLPVANFRESLFQEITGPVDVAMVKTSPPDEHGYMSFGSAVWTNRTVCSAARQIICEVHEGLIRTYGENFLHVSEVDLLVEGAGTAVGLESLSPRAPETVEAAEVICTLIASELINDGDTIQIGLGDVTSAMALYLMEKHDLGIQTELIPGGVVDLVETGVVTGRHKEIAPGKVVGSAFALLPPSELSRADLHPKFELWDFCHTDDLRTLVHERDFVAINNALQIDLTGQVTAETVNGLVYSGPGGQTTFAIAASVGDGGRSIIAVPSSSVVAGERRSRILATMPPGSVITTPRTYVDYVVTEYGIATLRGKTLRERASELIAVAHPDVRAELRRAAQESFHI